MACDTITTTRHHGAGSLEVICGPMFSGKSEELIRRLRRAEIARQHVLTFKSSLDNRKSLDHVVSHDGTQLRAQPIHTIMRIQETAFVPEVDVIGIDEVQFFSLEIIPLLSNLVEAGKRVIVAGLDLDFRGAPFGPMPLLLAIADKITKLRAICCVCGVDAHYTQRLVNGEPARYDDPTIMIGAQESYQARCRLCYRIDKKPLIGTLTYEQTENFI
ncbi:MAG: thymidine kinase [Candidatus Babeliales bacterium]